MTPRLSTFLYGAATVAALGAAVALAFSEAPAKPLGDPANPTVVEIYESQGCSSCPPANANVNALADRTDLLPLNFAVTYWDQLGWKDTFAKPSFTARQWDYARAAGRQNVATPQVIINGGRTTVVGNNAERLEAAIRANARKGPSPVITVANGKVSVAGTQGGAATVWLVRYDPRTLVVAISAGENGGRKLPHRNIVRSLEALGTVNGGSGKGNAASFALPASHPVYRSAILVQQGKGGPIIAAKRV